ncbi:MAG: lytic transglycosylase domain-containing protein, partial [Polyangiaceae bacterium]|nr:lytic transglycosylase domain-containing protein [Polyangiaceae bacterium]
ARARMVLADALELAGQMDRSAELWEQHLAAEPSGARWAHGAVRVAARLLRQPPDGQRAARAIALARRVLAEVPTASVASEAAKLEQMAVSHMPPEQRVSAALWPMELRVRRAEALASAGSRPAALDALDEVLQAMTPEQRKARVGCDAAFLRASVIQRDRKKRAQAADAHGAAILACKEHRDSLVRVLFAGAKTSGRAGRPAEAIARYARIEKEFAQHRLADDARLNTARALLSMKDNAGFERLLGTMASDYPDGDMVEDGLFELALHHIDGGNWKAAMVPLLESTRVRPKAKTYWEAGRARYFLARALAQTGQTQEAEAQLRRVILEHPFSYYMLLAYARVHASSPERAQALLSEGESAAPALGDARPMPPELSGIAFTRALELLAVGEVDAARAEVRSLGLGSDSREAIWRMAALYAQAGADVVAHQVARSRSEDWYGLYPQGRWRAAWELAYPRPHLRLVQQHAAAFGIPVPLAYGIMREESAFDATAISSADAYGLMQLIVPTAQSVAGPLKITVTPEALTQPQVNIQLGCKLLASLRATFPEATQLAIPSYNAGAGATKRWLREHPDDAFDLWVEHIDYEETRGYMKRVLSTVAVYSYLYDTNELEQALRLPLNVPPSH